MNTIVMKPGAGSFSPRSLARMAGVCQALEGVTATYGQVIVLGKLVVSGNAAATAVAILGHERLFWIGFASCLLGIMFHLAWALFIYEIMKAVSRRIALFALLVMLVGCAVQAVTAVLYLAPMLILNAHGSLSALGTEQLQALAYVFVRLNGNAFNTYLVFFGLWLLVTGWLIFQSSFMPRALGILVMIAGVGWMMYLVPPVATRLFIPYLAGASAIGEIPLLLWCLIMGVNNERWREQAGAP